MSDTESDSELDAKLSVVSSTTTTTTTTTTSSSKKRKRKASKGAYADWNVPDVNKLISIYNNEKAAYKNLNKGKNLSKKEFYRLLNTYPEAATLIDQHGLPSLPTFYKWLQKGKRTNIGRIKKYDHELIIEDLTTKLDGDEKDKWHNRKVIGAYLTTTYGVKKTLKCEIINKLISLGYNLNLYHGRKYDWYEIEQQVINKLNQHSFTNTNIGKKDISKFVKEKYHMKKTALTRLYKRLRTRGYTISLKQ